MQDIFRQKKNKYWKVLSSTQRANVIGSNLFSKGNKIETKVIIIIIIKKSYDNHYKEKWRTTLMFVQYKENTMDRKQNVSWGHTSLVSLSWDWQSIRITRWTRNKRRIFRCNILYCLRSVAWFFFWCNSS